MIAVLRRILRSFVCNERGAAIVEAAIVLPFVMVLGLGTIEFGWVMAQIQDVQTSLRDAVRYVTRQQLDTASVDFISSSAKTYGYGLLDAAFTRNGITIKSRNITSSALANSTGTYLGGTAVYTISGTATFTPASAGLLTMIKLTPPSITLSYEARHVGG